MNEILEALKNKKMAKETSSNKTTLISNNLINLFNYRIKQELNSAYIYKAMSLWLEDKGYFNGSKLWNRFYEEEIKHAKWAEELLLSLNIRPITPQIDMPTNEYTSYGDIIRKTLDHEILVTNECQELAKKSLEEGNIMAYTVAHKFVTEQVEELKKSYDLLNLLEIYGEEKLNIALLDHQIELFL